ncbi:tripartite tricarboxylate transporter substrate binding protein [Mycolicibacterium sp. 018/SC-01/001]|uniref:tripartite tricarboxylate transporter substrate binding protein n=1 Tax=Mycolicibacterium sp. 018/SC-01/001 TaxID=2592069 RepID=UPI00117C55DC|nr:tripartite tricarboxylate transporter substrate binding protein [Mycolicibacterium sp. 018/SC-01/001]TRW80954.1 tripartite tricarboxylate transporter substrate binding protein [Mycolicibacterium sp. 018/SC-01/001]
MHTRRFRRTVAATLAVTLLSAGCAGMRNQNAGGGDGSDNYPSGPVTMLVAFDPGGGSDVGARLMAKELEKELGQPVVVENKPGAGGQIGYTALSKAAPDGSLFGLTTIPGLLVSALDPSRKADYTVDSFAPSALQVFDPVAIAVAPNSPYKTLDDLVAAAKAAPGKITATTTGIGTTEHFALTELNQAAGIDIRPVHFADGAAASATAFLGGNVDLLLSNVGDVQPTLKSGGARLLTVMAKQRSPFAPDVPTTVESGYDVVQGSSRGYAFPAGTPDAVVNRMSDAIGTVMKRKEFQDQMKDLGLQPQYLNAADYKKFWDEQAGVFKDLIHLIHD